MCIPLVLVDIGFAESVRWRQPSAFTDRTLKLLNALEGTHVSLIALLLELSISVDHPYNAFWLHKNLIDRPLAERDAFWSRPLASEAEDGHPSYRLVSWALFAPNDNTTPEILALCAAALHNASEPRRGDLTQAPRMFDRCRRRC